LVAEDIAETVEWVVSRPAHVNINELELMCVDQAWSPFAVHRENV
jgi:NADP-dependent 3-hydroxy acid dehydrogenase YdfG